MCNNRYVFTALLLLATGFLCLAQAQVPMTGAGLAKPVAASAYTGPSDIVASPTVWYGFRGVNTAFSGNVADICDAATGLVCATATWAGSTLTIPTISGLTCGVGINCVVSKMYDQSGGTNHIVQATLSKMPAFTPTALNGQPCATFASANSQVLVGTALGTVAQPWTISTVAKRTGNTGTYTAVFTGGSSTLGLLGNNSANSMATYMGGGPAGFSVTDNSYHAIQAVFNNGSGVGYVDQTANTGLGGGAGSIAGNVTVGQITSFSYWEGSICEVGFWPIGFTGTTNGNSLNTGNMNTNQHNYWGVT